MKRAPVEILLHVSYLPSFARGRPGAGARAMVNWRCQGAPLSGAVGLSWLLCRAMATSHDAGMDVHDKGEETLVLFPMYCLECLFYGLPVSVV
jgi:hypothetical protein